MKKKLALAFAIIAIASNISLAQNYRMDTGSDGFFTTEGNGNRTGSSDNNEWAFIPELMGHGLTTNQAAPLGSGLLILGGMALGYGIRKRK